MAPAPRSRILGLLGSGLIALACSGETSHDSASPTGGAAGNGGSGNPAPGGAPGAGVGGAVALDGGTDAAGAPAGSAGGGGAGNADVSPVRSCKRGISVNDVSVADLGALAPSVGWFYDWAATVPGPLEGQLAATGMEFVPMVWGGDFTVEDVISSIPTGARFLLGFNEPNFRVGQANLAASDAAALWPMLEEIAAARDLEIVGPAVNYCGPDAACWNTDPFGYLDDFFAACSGCRVDYLAVHWYDCSGVGLQWFLDQARVYGKPIWLTEFNCPDGDAAAQLSYLQEAIPILEADPMVFRYAWLMARSTVPAISLLAGDGELTALGEEYVAQPPGSSCP